MNLRYSLTEFPSVISLSRDSQSDFTCCNKNVNGKITATLICRWPRLSTRKWTYLCGKIGQAIFEHAQYVQCRWLQTIIFQSVSAMSGNETSRWVKVTRQSSLPQKGDDAILSRLTELEGKRFSQASHSSQQKQQDFYSTIIILCI